MRIWVDLTNSPHVLAMRERFGTPHRSSQRAELRRLGGSSCRRALWTLKAWWLTLIWSFRPAVRSFEGRLGAVDEALLREGRLRKLDDPRKIVVEPRRAHGELRIRRDPRQVVKLLLSAKNP